MRTYCEHAEELANFLRANAIPVDRAHEVNHHEDAARANRAPKLNYD